MNGSTSSCCIRTSTRECIWGVREGTPSLKEWFLSSSISWYGRMNMRAFPKCSNARKMEFTSYNQAAQLQPVWYRQNQKTNMHFSCKCIKLPSRLMRFVYKMFVRLCLTILNWVKPSLLWTLGISKPSKIIWFRRLTQWSRKWKKTAKINLQN